MDFDFVRLFNRSYPSIIAQVETLLRQNTKTKIYVYNKIDLSSFQYLSVLFRLRNSDFNVNRFCAGIAIYQQKFVGMRAGFRSGSILSNAGESLTGVRLISTRKSSSVLHFFQEF